jgi:hypothetical protein
MKGMMDHEHIVHNPAQDASINALNNIATSKRTKSN